MGSESRSRRLDATREDFLAYEALRQQRALPTLLEEATPDRLPEVVAPLLPQVTSATESLSKAVSELPGASTLDVDSWRRVVNGAADGRLRAFESQEDEEAQRRRLIERREIALATKRFNLAATAGMRAGKDAGDILTYGVMPAAKAVSKVAARRLLPMVPSQLPGGDPSQPLTGSESASLAKPACNRQQQQKQQQHAEACGRCNRSALGEARRYGPRRRSRSWLTGFRAGLPRCSAACGSSPSTEPWPGCGGPVACRTQEWRA